MLTEVKIYQNPEVPASPDKLTYPISFFEIVAGNKALKLRISTSEHWASTFIDNCGPSIGIPGLATNVFQKATDIIRAISNLLQSPIDYQLCTRSEKMVAWAKDPNKGKGIFDWDTIEQSSGIFIASKRFYPLRFC